jgi:metallophosphoesterase superfamily enzyme
VWLDSRRAVWLERARLLVVADLHWGYALSHRARGNLLPLWGDTELAASLNGLVRDYAPAEMIWLGDVVHAAEGAASAQAYLSSATVPVTVLAGNHDRRWRGAGERTAQRGTYFFHHGDGAPAIPEGCIEIIGHHHPAAAWWDGAGGSVKMPALVAEPRRLVLPAFSPWAAGTDCRALETERSTVWAITARRIFSMPKLNRESTS